MLLKRRESHYRLVVFVELKQFYAVTWTYSSPLGSCSLPAWYSLFPWFTSELKIPLISTMKFCTHHPQFINSIWHTNGALGYTWMILERSLCRGSERRRSCWYFESREDMMFLVHFHFSQTYFSTLCNICFSTSICMPCLAHCWVTSL